MTRDEIIDCLNRLIQVCKDGEQAYREAGQIVRDTRVASVFNQYAKQRAHFVRDLQSEVERLGGAPSEHGSVAGALYRAWLDLKSVLSSGDPAAIVAACETGEDSAAAAFERVVNTGVTGHTRSLVEKQWRQIQEAHSHMLRMKTEDAFAAEPSANE